MKVILKICVLFVCLFIPALASAARVCPWMPPTIDGVIHPWEWDAARTIDIQVNLPEGGTAPARLYLMDDDQYLYVGLRILRSKPDAATSLAVLFDANGDRSLDAGDDGMVLTNDYYGGTTATDIVYYTGGACPEGALCSGADTDFGGSNDAVGAIGGDGTYVMVELRKPLATQDGMDAQMWPWTTLGMTFDLRLIGWGYQWPDGIADTYYPANPTFGQYVDYVIPDCGFNPY